MQGDEAADVRSLLHDVVANLRCSLLYLDLTGSLLRKLRLPVSLAYQIYVEYLSSALTSLELLARYEKPDREGPLHVKPAKKTWSRRWLMLKKDMLYLWNEKPSAGSKEVRHHHPRESLLPRANESRSWRFLLVW